MTQDTINTTVNTNDSDFDITEIEMAYLGVVFEKETHIVYPTVDDDDSECPF